MMSGFVSQKKVEHENDLVLKMDLPKQTPTYRKRYFKRNGNPKIIRF